MNVKQVWYASLKSDRLVKFYESPRILDMDAMWGVLRGMLDDEGRVPLSVEAPEEHWQLKIMRGKTYCLLPIEEIQLIHSQEFGDNERIFLSDHIRGTTSEQ